MKTDEYFRTYGRYLTFTHPLPLFMQWNLEKILKKVPERGKVLDLGTGQGFLLEEIKRANPKVERYGVDNASIRKAKQYGRCALSEVTDLPFEDNQFNGVVSNNVLHHEKDRFACYKEAFRVLIPGSRFTFADAHDAPDQEFAFSKRWWQINSPEFAADYKASADNYWLSLPENVRKLHPKEFHIPLAEERRLLREAGFQNINVITSPAYFCIISATKT